MVMRGDVKGGNGGGEQGVVVRRGGVKGGDGGGEGGWVMAERRVHEAGRVRSGFALFLGGGITRTAQAG